MRVNIVSLKRRRDGVVFGCTLTYLFWGSLLLRCGDVETNPGPTYADRKLRQLSLSSTGGGQERSTGRPRRGNSADVATSRPAEPQAEAPPPASEPEELTLGVVVSMLQRMESSLNGAAQYWGMNVGDMILMNIIYDVSAYCTSIVAQDGNRTIWHARNLDYDTTDLLRNLTINVNFRRGNKTVYTAVTYAGYVGVLTGQRSQAFTVSVDQRGSKKRRLGPWWANELTAILDKSSSFVSFLIRQALEESDTFSDACTKLSTTVTHAPVYIIVGGVHQGEGVVITRDREGALDRYYLDPLQASKGGVLQTNYDRWVPAPPSDAKRRAVAHAEMDKLGSATVNATALYNVLSTDPVMNK
ncbi:hypothetical protein ACOMHN_022121 [Nucella lapillus]